MSVISTVAVVLGVAIHYGRKPRVPNVYYFTLKQERTDINGTNSTSNALLQPASTLNATFAEALHAALRLPAAYTVSSISTWLEDATQPAQRRRLQETLPLQKQQRQLQQRQPANVLAVWGFQLWPSHNAPHADTMVDSFLNGEDAGMAVVLQLVAAGAVDPRAMGQLQGSISTSREDAFAAQDDGAAGTANAPLCADGMASEVLQYPPKPLPPAACTCRLGWDKERLGMDCPSPWATPAGTSKVPPALAVAGGRLIERASGAPAELHGVNYFGWNTDTPNFDGLWAYNDDEIPGYDSVGNAGALQLLNISWWGKRRVANDFAAVVHRMGLLGFNAVRVQFTFENLNRDLPAGTEPEFYPCLHDSDAYIGLDKTVDPQLTQWLAANQQQPDALLPLLPPYSGMQHPPPNNTGNAHCDSMPWSAPFGPNYTAPSSSTGSSSSLQLTMCNWYLPQGPGVLAVHRFLWQVQYLVSQGFYVLLDFASHRAEEPNMQQPQLLAANWAALWRMLTELPGYHEHLAGRVFPDLVNEPSRWNCQWDTSCRAPDSGTRSCAPATHLFGMAAAAVWQLDAAVPIFLNGLGQNRDYAKDQCGSNYPSMSWGDGFITDPTALQQHDLGDPSSLLATVAKMQGHGAGLVLAPHLYPPSISWNPAESAAAAAKRWDLSWGLKWQGQDVSPEGTPLPAMAVLLGEFGSKDYGDNGDTNSDTTVYSHVDKQWLRDTAAYIRGLSESTHSPVSWFFWAWNANSGDTQGIVGPGTTWREVQWTKVRMLTREYGMQPWYCTYFPTVCSSLECAAGAGPCISDLGEPKHRRAKMAEALESFCTGDELKALAGLFKTQAAAQAFCDKLTIVNTPLLGDRLAGIEEGVNTFFLTIMGALVFVMHAGFAMLCAGAIRSKNTMNILLQTILDAAVSAICWYLVGWGIAYGDITMGNGFIGTPAGYAMADWSNLTTNSGAKGRWSDWFFQWAFAATATTIPAGAVAERFNFNAYLAYTVFISAWVYPVIVHWVWSPKGWLSAFNTVSPLFGSGMIDFAGSAVVHMTGGLAGLMGCIMVGPRLGRFDSNGQPVDMPGHSATLVVLGTVLLWFGWYGFNPGSTLNVVSLAGKDSALLYETSGRAAVTTTLAGGAGVLTALITTFVRHKAWDLISVCNGALVGFVSITGSAAVVEPWAALIAGIIGSLIFDFTCWLWLKLRIDDPLCASPMHGICGMWGVLFAGFFATEKYVGQAYLNGKFGAFMGGGGHLLACQVVGILVIAAWICVLTGVLFFVLKMFGKLRISPEEEQAGLDVSKHGGSAYNYDHGLNKPDNIKI
uniref:Ammonium transporter AmtB-like domain-containing protein n=1 Tax=Tetradesmus obliquus TaxID=3088 RepID=A0A383WE90_TETOB|eukprot:jgi/Sobl393_1/901/SZX75563.1